MRFPPLQPHILHDVNSVDRVVGIAVGYHNLGNYLADQPAEALASHLAGALIEILADGYGEGSSRTSSSVRAAAIDLREFGGAAVPPRDIADLSARLAHISGTDLSGLIALLSPAPEPAEQTLRDLITQAKELATEQHGERRIPAYRPHPPDHGSGLVKT